MRVGPEAFRQLKTIGHGTLAPYIHLPLIEWSVHLGTNANYLILGAFGVVSLVKESSTGKLYAMKQVTTNTMRPPPSLVLIHSFASKHSCVKQICFVKGKKVMYEPKEKSSNPRHSYRPGAPIGLSRCTTASKTGITFTWCAYRLSLGSGVRDTDGVGF